ncbi:MAG TPA: tRNA (N(6)-L-threonylcarbamoyladenosine(37)-C(2))-methylthiotransferase MtaB [Chloroflexota bacterium]|nr:tRNA (N(6)-L-threonylcarbamoyladenosine(37)-C(2))-methylthiotransferase MtaB [Chloroflexota bacterium]
MTPASVRVAFYTLGCKVNQAETDQLASQFAAVGYTCVPFEATADVYVVNTCTVTHVGDAKSRQILRQAQRRDSNALVVATGCYASIAGDSLPVNDVLVVRNREKHDLVEIVSEKLGVFVQPNILDQDKYVAQGLLAVSPIHVHSRPMVKVQDGCDSACSYCIIPRARGRSRSVPPEGVVRQVEDHSKRGHPEVVITGVDLGSYGDNEPQHGDLGSLLGRLLAETSIPRVRVSSVEPGDFDPSWLTLWENPRLCRHFHVPLQAGSDGVLKRMRRKYDTAQFAEMLSNIRRHVPGVAVTTDVIVGFPGETEEEFAEGLAFIRHCRFDGMHVFSYSRRTGTAAARLEGQVPELIKKERSLQLRRIADAGRHRHVERFLGSVQEVAWEEQREDGWRGITDNNIRVFSQDLDIQSRSLEHRLLHHCHRDGALATKVGSEAPALAQPSSSPLG